MVGVFYVRVLEMSSYSYGDDYMVKKIVKWVMMIPIKVVEWVMWPVAKAHQQLKKLSAWLHEKM
jgi:hypothetical protein|tara:strand:+ start:175 stop:366 length:192 start_codon:yes stop_codon:yes gene_type:complete